MATITVNQGDDLSIQLTFKDKDKKVIDITNYICKFVVKKKLSDTNNEAIYINANITNKPDPINGVALVEITDAISKNWPIGKWNWQARALDATSKVMSNAVDILIVEEQAFDHE